MGQCCYGQQQSLESLQLIWDEGRMLGGGYEFTRHHSTVVPSSRFPECYVRTNEVAGQQVEWVERVQGKGIVTVLVGVFM